jgi:hypothetical protein
MLLLLALDVVLAVSCACVWARVWAVVEAKEGTTWLSKSKT